MTSSTVSRPSRPTARPAERRPTAGAAPAGDVLAGGLAGTAAALLGLLLVAAPVLVVWWGEDRSGTDVVDALRSAGRLWLLGHGVVLEVPAGRYGLLPLGLALVPAWLCWRAGRRGAQACRAGTTRGALRVAAGVALLYTGAAVVVTAAMSGTAPVPVLWTAVCGPLLLAAPAAVAGALRALPPGSGVAVPPRAVVVLRTGAAALLVLLAAGALLVAAALGLDTGAAAQVAEGTEPGAVGGLGLLLLGVTLAPNAVVWAASWWSGPGFAVGAGTAVGPFGVELGPVPALPLLSALPDAAPPTWLAVLALSVPVLSGVLAGWLLTAGGAWPRLLADAALAGVVAGSALGVLAAVSGGPLGGERLAVVGPSGWQTGTAVAVQVAVGVAAGAALRRRRAHPAAV